MAINSVDIPQIQLELARLIKEAGRQLAYNFVNLNNSKRSDFRAAQTLSVLAVAAYLIEVLREYDALPSLELFRKIQEQLYMCGKNFLEQDGQDNCKFYAAMLKEIPELFLKFETSHTSNLLGLAQSKKTDSSEHRFPCFVRRIHKIFITSLKKWSKVANLYYQRQLQRKTKKGH